MIAYDGMFVSDRATTLSVISLPAQVLMFEQAISAVPPSRNAHRIRKMALVSLAISS
jgi:hypothetical protein